MGIQVHIENDLSASERRQIIRELVAFNSRHAAAENDRDLIVVLRADATLIGGLIGFTHWNWLFVKQLWVSETFRSQGLGSRLMLAAEREALSRDCGHAHLTFDFHALLIPQAPTWMQRSGLEWAFRLMQEPRRLWKRYLRYNPRFVVAFTRQWLSNRR